MGHNFAFIGDPAQGLAYSNIFISRAEQKAVTCHLIGDGTRCNRLMGMINNFNRLARHLSSANSFASLAFSVRSGAHWFRLFCLLCFRDFKRNRQNAAHHGFDQGVTQEFAHLREFLKFSIYAILEIIGHVGRIKCAMPERIGQVGSMPVDPKTAKRRKAKTVRVKGLKRLFFGGFPQDSSCCLVYIRAGSGLF